MTTPPAKESREADANRPRGGLERSRRAHLRLGKRGERLALRLLQELGMEVLCRNYRCPYGEIDIVAREERMLCFVEVKTRRRLFRARPAAAVGQAKRKRIVRSAKHYLRELGRPPLPYRYDIVELIVNRGRILDARLWRNAFTEEAGGDGDRWPAHVPGRHESARSSPNTRMEQNFGPHMVQ